MSKTDAEIAREIMYDNVTKGSKPKPPKDFNVQATPLAVILESGGQRHQVPSIAAFNQLASAYEKTRNESRQFKVEIKRLTETIKKMDAALSLVEQELTNKADRYDND